MFCQRPRDFLLAIAMLSACACSSKSTPSAQDETPAPAPQADSPLTQERVAQLPKPGTVVPLSLAFADDDKSVSFLFSDDKSLSRQLYAMDLGTGERRQVFSAADGGNTEQNLSQAEKLERERRRERGLGVTRYSWSKDGNVLLIPLRGKLKVQDGLRGELRTLATKGYAPVLSPRLSRDGSMVAYVQDGEVYVLPTDGTGEPKQLTDDARGTGKVNGLAEYIAQEEMDRHSGFWWSRDGKHIAFTQVDETHIPGYRIMHQGKADTGASAQEDHGYPFAGAPNAKVKLGVVPVAGGKTVWMDLGPSDDIYLARVHWMPSGELWAQLENREQTQLELVRLDTKSGNQRSILSESSDIWINLHSHFRALTKSPEASFLWASERTGFMHLYLYDEAGKEVRALTSGAWPVDSVAGVDEEGKRVFFLSGKGDPTQRQLYEVGFDGGEPRQITSEAGTHGVRFSGDFSRFIDTHSSMPRPPRIHVRKTSDASIVASIHDTPDPEVAALKLSPPELVTLESRDGVTLHGAVYLPPPQFKAPYPTVVSVYGGPHAQRVKDTWGMTSDLGAQFLRSRGFLVFKLDNRGSARRGLAFEGAIKNDLGNIEVADQVDGVKWLVGKGWADASRVAITGWSYGGYMAAMALARAPETFQVGVAGAPVTHWDGYDTHYTERYMGTPKSNPEGYLESSVMHHLDGMKGSLLLVHGLIDENVHFRHTARLIDALIKAQKNYDLLLFPNERHSPRAEADKLYMQKRIFAYLEARLSS